MDLAVKLGVMLLAMAVLYLVADRFSEPKESLSVPPPLLPQEPPPSTYDPVAEEREVRPRAVGSARIENYGFATIDLRTGPADPEDFFDELYVQLYDDATAHSWQAAYTVCTPKGIARFMRDKGY